MSKKIPQRMCIGCHQMFDKKDLVRIVKTPENEILIDETGKKSGRGAYVCSNLECFKKVRKSQKLDKAFKTKIPQDIYEMLEGHLNER